MSKQYVTVAAVAAVLCACGAPAPPVLPTDPTAVDGGPVRFQLREVTAASAGCGTEGAACARARVEYLVTAGGGSEAARDNLDIYTRHTLVSRLRDHLADGAGDAITTVDGLVAAFLAQHRAFTIEFPEASAEWYLELSVAAIHGTARVTTLDITEDAFTGGAHPNSWRKLVSFDTVSGQLLGVEDLTGDVEALTAAVERQFRTDRGLGSDDDLEAAGFWFPDGVFTLTDNLGIVGDGLLFHWNAYEIAPYSMGAITVLVPAVDLEGVVTYEAW